MTGPLKGYRVLELAGIGPGPFCGMMLADMGADVLRIERGSPPAFDATRNAVHRGRRSINVDLKNPDSLAAVLRLVEAADVLLEGIRPGVLEKLGLGPEVCHARNQKLVYARMTGWGQTGPMAMMAGHDINYFAISGSLHMCGPAGAPPHPNLNLVADMGGGGMMMAFGIVCALLEAGKSGQGQVIDAAMVEGSALLATMVHAYRNTGRWAEPRGENILDGGAPFYNVYETADGGFMAVGSIEAPFYALLVKGIGLDLAKYPEQHDRAKWPEMKAVFAQIFKTRTRAAWEAVFDGTDACVTPVLTPEEAAVYPHMVARGAFGLPEHGVQPMPAPKFSRTPGAALPAGEPAGREALREWGLTDAEAGWLT